MKTFAAILMLSLSALACSSTGGAQRTNRDIISTEELQGSRTANAYDAVRQLRPTFLQRRGPSSLQSASAGYPTVRMDATPLGGLEQLRTIPTEIVLRIEFINSADATTRWGTGHTAGVILVTTRK